MPQHQLRAAHRRISSTAIARSMRASIARSASCAHFESSVAFIVPPLSAMTRALSRNASPWKFAKSNSIPYRRWQ
jgi:hypothetical protein